MKIKNTFYINKMKDKIKNKNGISTIEWVICILIFIMLFSFLFDLYFISYKQFRVSSEASNLMRVIANQSGVEKNTPHNYPGGDENYLSVDEAYDRLDNTFKGLGISENDWTAEVSMRDKTANQIKDKTITLKKGQLGIKGDYRDYVTLKITFKYKWGIWSQMVPSDITGTILVERHGFAEWKEDYDTWEGEN